MSLDWCKKGCGKLLRDPDNCRCTLFDVTDEDGDSLQIWAIDAESAAEKYGEETDAPNDNYILDSPDGVVVTILDQKYRITAEPSIDYSASEVNDDE